MCNATSDSKCSQVTCGNPPTVPHTTATSSGGALYGDMVTFTCTAGYQGGGTIECKVSQATPAPSP